MVRHIADIKPVRALHADPENSPCAAYTCHLPAECPTIRHDEGTNVICPIVLIERENATPGVREPNRYVERG
ncbi:unnamed protein product [Lasius platythorax]|uniref:Uncharacterized protein n=1 Tax=Lasius platythorax TaxID=488582 RepID=A0AAV2P1I8_9HYME